MPRGVKLEMIEENAGMYRELDKIRELKELLNYSF
jgi:hypothetical protein